MFRLDLCAEAFSPNKELGLLLDNMYASCFHLIFGEFDDPIKYDGGQLPAYT